MLWRPGVKAWSIIAQAIFVLSNVPGRYCLDRAMHVMPLHQRLEPTTPRSEIRVGSERTNTPSTPLQTSSALSRQRP